VSKIEVHSAMARFKSEIDWLQDRWSNWFMCILVYVEVVEELVVRIPLKELNPNSMLHLFTWDEEEEDKYALKKKG